MHDDEKNLGVCGGLGSLAFGFRSLWARRARETFDGKVVDEQGASRRACSVTGSGPGAAQTTFTDPKGEFRFLNLSVGSYKVVTTLQGFSTVERNDVVVKLGQNTEPPDHNETLLPSRRR